MGTRSLITIEDNGAELTTIFRHWDGYPSVAGRDIQNALKNCRVVNGIVLGEETDYTRINGMGRLACVLITKLSEHNPRIVPTGTRDMGEEYTYTVSINETDDYSVGVGPLKLTVRDYDSVIYDGPLDDFDPDMEDEAA